MEAYDHGQEFRDKLEALLDQTSPDLLIEALAVIATDKALHVRAAWQDEATAKLWEKIARSLDREANRLLKYGNPYA
jgi:dTDP-4-dehydrorhamnose reductase